MAALATPGDGQEKVILDTDSGPFNDDGIALVMLLQSASKISLQGVTCVPGNVWAAQGAEYMLANVKMMHRTDVPVFVGAAAPLMNTPAMAAGLAKLEKVSYIGAFAANPAEIQKPYYGSSGLKPGPQSAVDFIIDTVEKHPGEITILAIGPMTNLAIALRMRPDIETKIKRLVYMGGAFHAAGNTTRTAEFNFWFDPEAARIVLRSRIAVKVMFGLDISNHAVLRKSTFDEIITVKTPVTKIYEEDFGRRGFPGFFANPNATAYLWDELAAGYLIDPSFVTKSERAYLDVDTTFSTNYGRVVPLDRKLAPDATPVEVMLDLNAEKAFALYKELLTRPVR